MLKGKTTSRFLHIDDFLTAVNLIISSKNISGQIFNLGMESQ